MPINVALKSLSLDIFTLRKVGDCCPQVFAVGEEGILKFNRLSKLIAHWMFPLCVHSIIYFVNAASTYTYN